MALSTRFRAALTACALLAVTACGGGDGGEAAADAAAKAGNKALSDLITKAREEGGVTFYSVPPEDVARALADAFTEKYGIDATFVRLTAAPLAQRFSAEAQAGRPGADVIMVSNSPFYADGIAKDWLTPLPEAGIPGYPGGLPADFVLADPGTAVVQVQPSGFGYNTDMVSEKDAPKDWPDLLDPKWKGKILMANPKSSPAYVDFWYMIEKEYGIDYLQDLRGQVARFYDGTVPLTEAMAAGEGAITVPNVTSSVQPVAAKGAPVAINVPDLTNGPEIVAGVATKAQHPHAARLFTHFVLSEEGNRILNSQPGSVSPYDKAKMPARFTRITHADAVRKEKEILGALGAD
ncbi:ABC transporter substrate-binding protein [Kibdelosporangium persicum]|uniref:ABC transporter substrate-binding protein n=1 Tax=Kibdelosporangium persicum TaxID=2698649 RepID=A0ABX2FAN5_9PSEU|nr:extracellular solute-binding protein [Kibdelosporangium persicum]NRN67952.1 ABC transporter substrate-binding protein [Kibdelosporangium persicum]